ncbi:hemerythrin domain-containing protein [Rhizobium cremeum]|uniref:hemerythrin domain-containing protein n=1 Tax=Rhizobium cremeum TaxID=2813827 RepID=UPI000DDB9828
MTTEIPLNAQDLAALDRNHEALLALCIKLEDIADSLPFDINEDLCNEVAQTVAPLLKQTQQLEEKVLFPDFDRSAGSCFAAMMIERLKGEHRCDGLAAEEISLTLKAVIEGRCRLSFDTVGYMLRGFFECVRRHVAAEKLMIEALCAAEAEGREILM